MAGIDVSKYAHSPVHKAVVLKDYANLREILASLPRLVNPFNIQTEAASIAEEEKAATISAVIDRRDVPNRDSPLHLAAKLGDDTATEMLMVAGANRNLKNKQGRSPVREAVFNKQEKVGMIMLRHSWLQLDEKFSRCLPRYLGTLRRMRNFYMEITFHFESSVIPFISRIAPSDTYKIWKMGGNMRADFTLVGFDGLRIKRADMSVLFLGDDSDDAKKIPGSVCLLSHKDKEVIIAPTPEPPTDEQLKQILIAKSTETMHQVRIDVSQAHLEPQLTWRGKEKKEMVGAWKAKVYDMRNIIFCHKSGSPPGAAATDGKSACRVEKKENNEINDLLTEEEKKQLEVALASKMDSLETNNEDENGHQNGKNKGKKGRSSKHRDKEHKKGKDTKKSSGSDSSNYHKDGNSENGFKRGMRPTLWLSPDFPLKLEELIPMLDILADRVKAVRRVRDLLKTKFPKETFPVKVAIPVVATVRVVVTFTKFEELQVVDEFSSAPSSPTATGQENPDETHSSASWVQWMKLPSFRTSPSAADSSSKIDDTQDLFAIPSDYTWITDDEKKKRKEKNNLKKSQNR